MTPSKLGSRIGGLLEEFRTGLICWLGYWVIRAVCSTLRWEYLGWEEEKSVHASGKQIVYAFWHGRMFLASYFFRNRGIVVMVSNNRDGEYIARVIERLGYGTARGSSSRGSRGATFEMLRALQSGRDCAVTGDGPRGPRYVAKPGAAYIAWKSGCPLMPFTASAQRKWVLPSWDHFIVPRPFSRALALMGKPIHIDSGAGEQEIHKAEAEIQRALEELRERADSWWGKASEIIS